MSRLIAPPGRGWPDAAQVQVLFAEARRRRWRRRLAAGVAGIVLAGLAVAAGSGAWSHPPRRGPAHATRRPAAARRGPGFSLPPAAVAWVDYSGQLHIGDVATLAQHVAGTIPAWAGAGWLVQAGGRIYGADSPVIREFNPATGTALRLGPGVGVFPSADGRHAYVERTSTSLVELRASGRGVLRRLRTPAGWYLAPDAAGEVTAGAGGAGILVSSRPDGPSRSPWNLAAWDPATGKVTLVARGAVAVGTYTAPGGRYSLIAWAPAPCTSRNCPIEITNTATRTTVTARSPLPYGFAQGAAFSPDGTRLAVFERTASINSSCCANNSVLAIANTRTGAVRAVRAARLVTQEDAGWILWLPGGRRLLAGALAYSYAVDAITYATRPFFFFPQTADGPDADHDIMDTPDVNFSAVLLPPAAARPAASAAPGPAALARDRAARR
ncbi:MAG: hypothetical protein ACRDOH_23075 [Streptosporangiaceae bacterium]